jgi:hypothetical protein
MLYVCTERFDMSENLEIFLVFGVNAIVSGCVDRCINSRGPEAGR